MIGNDDARSVEYRKNPQNQSIGCSRTHIIPECYVFFSRIQRSDADRELRQIRTQRQRDKTDKEWGNIQDLRKKYRSINKISAGQKNDACSQNNFSYIEKFSPVRMRKFSFYRLQNPLIFFYEIEKQTIKQDKKQTFG